MQCAPVNGDLAAADAEKAAEVDDGRAHFALAIDQHVNDPSHVLVGAAQHLAAENALDLVSVEHRDCCGRLRRPGGRLWCRRRGSALCVGRSRRFIGDASVERSRHRQQCGRDNRQCRRMCDTHRTSRFRWNSSDLSARLPARFHSFRTAIGSGNLDFRPIRLRRRSKPGCRR